MQSNRVFILRGMCRIALLLILVFISSCSDSSNNRIAETEYNMYLLEVYCEYCENENCTVPIPIGNLNVGVFLSFEDAFNGTDRISEKISDEHGRASFILPEVPEVFVKVSFESGNYISKRKLSEATSHLFVRAHGECYFEDNDVLCCQKNISWTSPQKFQKSKYAFFYYQVGDSDSILHYTGDVLNVEILQNFEGELMLRDYFINPSDQLLNILDDPSESRFKMLFDHDTMRLEEPSFYENRNNMFCTKQTSNLGIQAFSFPLHKVSSEPVSLNHWEVRFENWPPTVSDRIYFIENVTINGLFHEHLNLTFAPESGIDTHDFYYFYTPEKGLVRSLFEFSHQNKNAYSFGFDLID